MGRRVLIRIVTAAAMAASMALGTVSAASARHCGPGRRGGRGQPRRRRWRRRRRWGRSHPELQARGGPGADPGGREDVQDGRDAAGHRRAGLRLRRRAATRCASRSATLEALRGGPEDRRHPRRRAVLGQLGRLPGERQRPGVAVGTSPAGPSQHRLVEGHRASTARPGRGVQQASRSSSASTPGAGPLRPPAARRRSRSTTARTTCSGRPSRRLAAADRPGQRPAGAAGLPEHVAVRGWPPGRG